MSRSYRPAHRVTLKRAANNFAEEDMSRDILAISLNKGYGDPLGGFTIVTTFKRRFNNLRYDELIKPNDILLIELDKGDGKGLVKRMLGLASAPERVFSVDTEGRPSRTVHITGYDFGKILTQHHCKWYTAPQESPIGSEDSEEKVKYGAALVAGGTANALVKKIIEVELHQVLPWTADHILTDRVNSSDDWQTIGTTFSYNDPLWQVLTALSNWPYNMLHADTGDDGKYHVILEKCPYDNETGRLERTLKPVDSRDVTFFQLGANDHDRRNYIWLMTQSGIYGEHNGLQFLNLKGDALKFNYDSNDPDDSDNTIKQHGFRPWFPQTNFVPFTNATPIPPQLSNEGSKESVKRPVRDRTLAFWNWYRRNHRYESGIITMHGDPDVRAGDGILFDDNGFEYFVEHVSDTYRIFPTVEYKSTLHVTRGQKHA